jgi:hypothetical protein
MSSYEAFAPGVDRERISQCCHDPSDAAPQRMLQNVYENVQAHRKKFDAGGVTLADCGDWKI